MHETLARYEDRLFGEAGSFDAQNLRKLGKGINPALAEKSVHALEYVAQLGRLKLPFVFVGGTAVQLLLAGGISRLSKDVDVVAPGGSADTWRRAVLEITRRFGGEVYAAREEQRDHGGLSIPALHFLIVYPTVFPSDAKPDIELDVVFAPARFPTQETPLVTHYHTPKSPASATTPTADALFGGKLTTLGPGTIGIPRGKANFDLATGKQLFDLARLVTLVRDLGVVADAYRAAYEVQLSYRAPDARPTLEAVLEDALYALKVLAAPPNAAGQDAYWSSDLRDLSQAAVKLRGYVGDKERFDRLAARRAAGMVALALVHVRHILLGGVPPQEAQARWLRHLARVQEEEQVTAAVAAAKEQLSRLPWPERPHLNIREFVGAVGPQALLYWDAVYQELRSA
jgi:hypothetical protein